MKYSHMIQAVLWSSLIAAFVFVRVYVLSPKVTKDFRVRTSRTRIENADQGLTAEELEARIEEVEARIGSQPQDVAAHLERGYLCGWNDNYAEALKSFEKAVELNPKGAEAYSGRGWGFEGKQEWKKAIADYTRALKLDPSDKNAMAGLAWIMSTCPVSDFRSGKEALQLAEKVNALRGRKDILTLDTLAAAYAEIGDFSKANSNARQALYYLANNKTKAEFDSGYPARLRARLREYEAKKPHRDTGKDARL